MKKIFTLAVVLAATTFTFGQRYVDLKVTDIIKPDTLYSTPSGSPFTFNVSAENTGPDDLLAGDTIFYSMAIIIGNQAIVNPSNALQGGVIIGKILTRDVPAGDTFHFEKRENVNQVINPTGQVNLRIVLIARGNDLPFESGTDVDNNVRTEPRIWFNIDKFPLSIGQELNSMIQVYPNPAAEKVNFVPNTVSVNNKTELALYDLQGKMVYSNNIEAGVFGNFEVETTNLKNGVYIYRVQSGDQILSGKFSVQH